MASGSGQRVGEAKQNHKADDSTQKTARRSRNAIPVDYPEVG